jgi:hypothetical protein
MTIEEPINVIFKDIYRLGYLEVKVPQDIMSTVCAEIKEMDEAKFNGYIPVNNKLAGNIQHEYSLHKSYDILNALIKRITPSYWRGVGAWNKFRTLKNHFIIKRESGEPDLWVNFQQPNEINPMHAHDGMLSFVLWVQLPFTMEDENNHPSVKNSHIKSAAKFSFLYPSAEFRGGVGYYDINADRDYEGTMIIFPANLTHAVSPFKTSNKYRISVSGNISHD